MKEKSFYIVSGDVLPEIFLKVLEVKHLLETEQEKTVQEATHRIGISRSAFYKYRSSVFPLYENTRGKTVTIALNLRDIPGLLSNILNNIADANGNILTINQNIPLNNLANVTITIELKDLTVSFEELIDKIEDLDGVQSLKIIARE